MNDLRLPLDELKRHTWYLSGPMSRIEDNNYPAFNKMACKLRAAGFKVINPAELEEPNFINESEIQQWALYLARDLGIMINDCNAIVMMDGFGNSRGAMLELAITSSQPDRPIYHCCELLAKAAAPQGVTT